MNLPILKYHLQFLTKLTDVVYIFVFDTRPPTPSLEKNSKEIGKNGHISYDIPA